MLRGKLSVASLARSVSEYAPANTKEQFDASPDFKDAMIQSVADGFDKYSDMAKQVLNSSKVQDGLAALLGELVYAGFAKQRRDNDAASV